MHLERVTSRSSEAGLAGWIASNDVTLFTMILVMAIAIFLHSKLNKGAAEQNALANQNTAISATLAATARELESVRQLLAESKDRLTLTQAERDQLQAKLVEKLTALAELNAKLDALVAEKGELSRQQKTLLAEKEALAKEKLAIEGARDTASATNVSLQSELESLTAKLAEKIAALEEIEAQRDRLTKQATELTTLVTALKTRLEEMNVDVNVAKQLADKTADDLRAQAAAADKKAEDYLADLKRATEMLATLKLEKQQLQTELTAAERKRQAELLAEAENNRALVGLRGPMRKVAILFDASGSMRQEGAGGSDRWSEAQEITATWLKHLNVQECVLIVYSTDVRTFPQDGKLADLRGEQGGLMRDLLLQQLATVAPGGWTDTHAAFQKAYEYDVDTILLLSDGAPSKVASGVYQDELAQQIYQLCRDHAGIPVNTIGLGNYFDKDMSNFLRTVASLTGGAFRGE